MSFTIVIVAALISLECVALSGGNESAIDNFVPVRDYCLEDVTSFKVSFASSTRSTPSDCAQKCREAERCTGFNWQSLGTGSECSLTFQSTALTYPSGTWSNSCSCTFYAKVGGILPYILHMQFTCSLVCIAAIMYRTIRVQVSSTYQMRPVYGGFRAVNYGVLTVLTATSLDNCFHKAKLLSNVSALSYHDESGECRMSFCGDMQLVRDREWLSIILGSCESFLFVV